MKHLCVNFTNISNNIFKNLYIYYMLHYHCNMVRYKKMKLIIKSFFVIVALSTLVSCTSKPRVVKSPCVANQSNGNFTPCLKRPVNKWLA